VGFRVRLGHGGAGDEDDAGGASMGGAGRGKVGPPF
jgi:hypothetical protein